MKYEKYQCTICGMSFPAARIQGMYPADDSIVCKNCFGHSSGEKYGHAGARPALKSQKNEKVR